MAKSKLSFSQEDSFFQLHLNSACYFFEMQSFSPLMLEHAEARFSEGLDSYLVYTRQGQQVPLWSLPKHGALVVLHSKSVFYDITEFGKEELFYYRIIEEVFVVDQEREGRLLEIERLKVQDVPLGLKARRVEHAPKGKARPVLAKESRVLAGQGGQVQRGITRGELARHDAKEDAWVAVRGLVYNVSGYLRLHPGGINILLNHAGKDVTAEVENFHSWVNVEHLLEKEKLGWLE
jgi:predicted heme/steroid binding protein